MWNLRVDPDYRSRGIGSLLMKEVEKYGKNIKVDCILLVCDKENIRAQKFYKKLQYDGGFVGFYKKL